MRNTPVEAGKTSREGQATVKSRKHPRRGGEDSLRVRVGQGKEETPPPRRGRLLRSSPERAAGRNTPAEAGKTRRSLACSSSEGKHPRRGGEDPCYAGRNTFDTETPPPRRGRHERPSKVTASYGNTPAEAGKTRVRTGSTSASGKHPRRGGEDAIAIPFFVSNLETPPPRRGRQEGGPPDMRVWRNTPAEAGKTVHF